MKVISINVNGFRAYHNRGDLKDLIAEFIPDVICIQETKCNSDTLSEIIESDYHEYQCFINSNEYKAGYAGVMTLVKKDINVDAQVIELNPDNNEYFGGRILLTKVGKYTIVNVYTLNSDNKDELRIQWDSLFKNYIKSLTKTNLIVIGDFNVVKDEVDHWRGRSNVVNQGPGLMEYEYNGLYSLCIECSLYDSLRCFTDKPAFSWFSYRGDARWTNKGWRLDYAFVNDKARIKLISSKVYSNFDGSDHRPIEIILN